MTPPSLCLVTAIGLRLGEERLEGVADGPSKLSFLVVQEHADGVADGVPPHRCDVVAADEAVVVQAVERPDATLGGAELPSRWVRVEPVALTLRGYGGTAFGHRAHLVTTRCHSCPPWRRPAPSRIAHAVPKEIPR